MPTFKTQDEVIAFEAGRDAARRQAAYAAGLQAGGQAPAAPAAARAAPARPTSTAPAAASWDDVAAKLNKSLGVRRPNTGASR